MNISIGENWLNKKNPFEYIAPSPSRGVGTIMKLFWILGNYLGNMYDYKDIKYGQIFIELGLK